MVEESEALLEIVVFQTHSQCIASELLASEDIGSQHSTVAFEFLFEKRAFLGEKTNEFGFAALRRSVETTDVSPTNIEIINDFVGIVLHFDLDGSGVRDRQSLGAVAVEKVVKKESHEYVEDGLNEEEESQKVVTFELFVVDILGRRVDSEGGTRECVGREKSGEKERREDIEFEEEYQEIRDEEVEHNEHNIGIIK